MAKKKPAPDFFISNNLTFQSIEKLEQREDEVGKLLLRATFDLIGKRAFFYWLENR